VDWCKEGALGHVLIQFAAFTQKPAGPLADLRGQNQTGPMNIHSSAGAPALNLGEVGDLYVDTTSETLYKKTDHSTWTALMASGAGAAEAYTPDEEADWDPVPATLGEAVDQLAARMTVAEGA
jgi:hypothetical protein